MDQNQRKKDAVKKDIQRKKNQESACKEKRVILLKNVYSERASKQIEEDLKQNHPFQSLNRSLERKGSFRMFVTYSTAKEAANALNHLKSSAFAKKGVFVTLASPSKAIKKADQKHNTKVIEELVEVSLFVSVHG